MHEGFFQPGNILFNTTLLIGCTAVKAVPQTMSPTCAPRSLPSGRLMEELAGGAGIGGEEEGTLRARTQGRPAGWGACRLAGFYREEERREGVYIIISA